MFNQNARGWNNSTKIETAIQIMIDNNIGVMTIQETWRPGNEEFEIRGFLVITHN
jgi:hypothetical protein